MPSRYLHGVSQGGLDTVLLQNDRLSLTVVPSAGGKILVLKNRRTGRDWLWTNPHIPLAKARRGDDFAKTQDSGGWDEVLLSVKPAKIAASNGHIDTIPDHGDLLSSEWSVDDLKVDAANNLTLTMSAQGIAADYRFERKILLAEHAAAVEFSYLLRNDSEHALPCYWCAHPLLTVERDAVIDIAGNMPLRVEDPATRARLENDIEQSWPNLILNDGQTIDLARSYAARSTPQGSASKIFVRAPATGSAGVVLKNGERLTFHFDTQVLPWLGLWINNGAWSGCGSDPYTNLGIEPATSPYDCINEAIENDAVEWLQPGEDKRWSLRVEMQA